jgi:hypothetical protein
MALLFCHRVAIRPEVRHRQTHRGCHCFEPRLDKWSCGLDDTAIVTAFSLGVIRRSRRAPAVACDRRVQLVPC